MDACYMELEAMLGDLYKEAQRVLVELPPMPRLAMLPADGDDVAGRYVYDRYGLGQVQVHPQTCSEAPEVRRFVVAHELGHAIAHAVYGRAGDFDENLANMYAARYYPRDAQQGLLATWDSRCASGRRPVSCENAASWRWAMAH